MKIFDSESGISEVIGVILLFGIAVIVLGTTQVYYIPQLNAATDRSHLEDVYSDMLRMRYDIEEVARLDIPKTTDIRMGERYTEWLIFRNPGPGIYGTLTIEPVNVTVKIDGNITNFISSRIIYESHGVISQPKFVYEHGLIIKDFTTISFNESDQNLVDENNMYVPVVFAPKQSVSSMEPESFSIFSSDKNNIRATTINITLDTSYPDLWYNLTKGIPGVNVGIGEKKIYINRSIPWVSYPVAETGFYSGMITDEVPEFELQAGNDELGVHRGGTGEDGMYSNERSADHLIDIPSSTAITKFVLDNITVVDNLPNKKYFSFVVTGKNSRFFGVEVDIDTDYIAIVKIYNNSQGSPDYIFTTPISNEINLTSYYRNASINSPNSLVLSHWESPQTANDRSYILYLRFVII